MTNPPDVIDYLKAIRAILDQPVQRSGLTTPQTAFILRCDADLARHYADKAIELAMDAIPIHGDDYGDQ